MHEAFYVFEDDLQLQLDVPLRGAGKRKKIAFISFFVFWNVLFSVWLCFSPLALAVQTKQFFLSF